MILGNDWVEKNRRCCFRNEMLKKNSKRNINQKYTEGVPTFYLNIFCFIKESQSGLCDFLTATYLKK